MVRVLLALKTKGWDAHMGEYILNGRDGQKKQLVHGVMGIYRNGSFHKETLDIVFLSFFLPCELSQFP